MPTTAQHTWSGKKLEPFQFPHLARTIAVKLPANVTLARGTILGEVTATPGTFAAYANANANGTQDAKAILAFDVSTDASGNITFGTTAGGAGGEWGEKEVSVPAYVAGYFRTTELVGLDAAGLADMSGNVIQGTLADGVIRLG